MKNYNLGRHVFGLAAIAFGIINLRLARFQQLATDPVARQCPPA
jgi:hypothetical protein